MDRQMKYRRPILKGTASFAAAVSLAGCSNTPDGSDDVGFEVDNNTDQQTETTVWVVQDDDLVVAWTVTVSADDVEYFEETLDDPVQQSTWRVMAQVTDGPTVADQFTAGGFGTLAVELTQNNVEIRTYTRG